MLESLKIAVYEANQELKGQGLSVYGWGNVSGIDRARGIVAVKPSRLFHDALTPDKIMLVDLDGRVIEGDLELSTDTPTHLELYRHFLTIGGICHTHSRNATAWAQACRPIPCLGTTHANYYYGEIPVTRPMTEAEIRTDYELNTGRVIVEAFGSMRPDFVPSILVANHGPFSWGANPAQAVESAMVLEQVAEMAFKTAMLRPSIPVITQALMDKHFSRKNGQTAPAGQWKNGV